MSSYHINRGKIGKISRSYFQGKNLKKKIYSSNITTLMYENIEYHKLFLYEIKILKGNVFHPDQNSPLIVTNIKNTENFSKLFCTII